MELQAGARASSRCAGGHRGNQGAAANIRNAPPSVRQAPEGTEQDREDAQSERKQALAKVVS